MTKFLLKTKSLNSTLINKTLYSLYLISSDSLKIQKFLTSTNTWMNNFFIDGFKHTFARYTIFFSCITNERCLNYLSIGHKVASWMLLHMLGWTAVLLKTLSKHLRCLLTVFTYYKYTNELFGVLSGEF